jgi:hypothetical protein
MTATALSWPETTLYVVAICTMVCVVAALYFATRYDNTSSDDDTEPPPPRRFGVDQ